MANSIIDQLAHAQGRRDEVPNVELAEKLVRTKNIQAIGELVDLLSNRKAALSHDAIKVLYEIGYRNPEFISGFLSQFLQTLQHRDNRMKWGAMCALSSISRQDPSRVAKHIVEIVEAMDKGTVITRDHGMYILTDIARMKKYHAACMALLLEQIEKAPVNQVPMYAEKTAEVISPPYVAKLISILKKRKDVMEIPSKAKRIEKLFKLVSSKM